LTQFCRLTNCQQFEDIYTNLIKAAPSSVYFQIHGTKSISLRGPWCAQGAVKEAKQFFVQLFNFSISPPQVTENCLPALNKSHHPELAATQLEIGPFRVHPEERENAQALSLLVHRAIDFFVLSEPHCSVWNCVLFISRPANAKGQLSHARSHRGESNDLLHNLGRIATHSSIH
jgi:hypothetical protein